MPKRPPQVEWHIAESDAEWDALRTHAPLTASARRSYWGAWLLILFALGIGVWFWRPDTAALLPDAPEHELAIDWGPLEALTTTHFVFHFYARDGASIAAVAPRLEQFYTAFQQDVGVAVVDDPPLSVTLSTTHLLDSAPYRPRQLTAIAVSSPTLYPATEWATDARLTQSLVLPLLDHTLALAARQHGFDVARYPLLDGVRLWLLWDADLPLARWKPALIQWIYVALPTQATTELLPLPADYAALCAAHQQWMVYPVQLQIPLLCQGMDESPRRLPYTMIRQAPRRLPPLDIPIYPDEEVDAAGQRTVTRHPGYAIAVATLLDYVHQRYGRAAVPRLVAEWGRGATWEELALALFTVTAADFERDWQVFLDAQE